MPEVGDTISAPEAAALGLDRRKKVWARCPGCGLERWAAYSKWKTAIRECVPCRIQSQNPRYHIVFGSKNTKY